MIPFNTPTYTPKTLDYIKDVFAEKHASGDGKYTKKVHNWFKKQLDCKQTLLVHSGTAALEMAAILADLKPGDEVIMPSYTFCSTANAFVLQGAIPVFIDIRPDTLNIDETKIEGAITDKTVIEDAAQAFDSFYKGRPLGLIGDMGCFSFHETKNIMSGEGGLFVTNNEKLAERAEIIREKGTNRSKFFRGQVDKYTWVDKGSSYLPSDIIAAYLYSILEISDQIQTKRISVWQKYYEAFEALETQGYIRRPIIPKGCTNNGHMFYLLLNDLQTRTEFIAHLKNHNIYAPFHYIPLHSAPAGENYCKTPNSMSITNKISDTLVRLPMFYDITDEQLEKVIKTVLNFWSR